MSVKIAGIEFDRVDYNRGGDVLYLHVGTRATRSTGTNRTKATHSVTVPTDHSWGSQS
jgi:hypothetical protein